MSRTQAPRATIAEAIVSAQGAIYARRSNRRDDSASIDMQIDACRKLADNLGIPVSDGDLFIDASVSGAVLERPAWLALAARLHEFTDVLMFDPSRLGREPGVSAAIRKTIRGAGVHLRLVTGDTSGMGYSTRVLVEPIFDGIQAGDRAKIIERMYPARRKRATKGQHAGKLPLGWKTVRDDKGRSIGAEIDHEWDPFYADLEGLVLSGASWNEITRVMRALGHKSPHTGKAWYRQTLWYLALDPWNMGIATFGQRQRGKFVREVFEAPEDTAEVRGESPYGPRWKDAEAVRAELRRRSMLKGRARWQSARLAGILLCFGCGEKLSSAMARWTRADGTRMSRRYYRCRHHAEFVVGLAEQDCPFPQTVYERPALDQIAAFLEWTLASNPEAAVDRTLAQYGQPNGTNLAELQKRLAAADRNIASLVSRVEVVPDAALPELRHHMDDLAAERDGLRQAIAEIGTAVSAIPSREAVLAALQEAGAMMAQDLAEAPVAEVNAILRKITPVGVPVFDGTLIFEPEAFRQELEKVGLHVQKRQRK
jgi:DNA invertase Pin-like site-specific DNA recombinase